MHQSPRYIAQQPAQRAGDRQILFLVRYADATSATLRLSPGIAALGPLRVLTVAAERQASGQLAAGKITQVVRVR
jgi:hypothetical protein